MVPLGELTAPAGFKAGKDTNHQVYSVTKHAGFVPSAEYFKKQIFSRELGGYKRVRSGDFAYATIHLDEGSIGIAPADGLISPMYTVFRPEETLVDPSYLLRFMKSPAALAQYPRFGKGSVHRRKSISLDALSKLMVPLPPLDEQRRIAAVLDHADDLRTKQRGLIAKLDHLTQAIFEAVFSSGPTSPRWPIVRLGDVVPTIDSGSSPVCENREASDGEWGVLKLGAISYGVFNPEENKAFLGDPASVRKVEVEPGDLLFSRKNTKELVGATAVAYESPPLLLLPDLIFRLNIDRERVDAEYLHALLRSPRTRPAVVALASGSASSMSNISKARLVELPIELPPIDLQHAYSDRVRTVNSLRDHASRVIVKLDDLFASLQSRAFSGQL